jgi:hypothetical protein
MAEDIHKLSELITEDAQADIDLDVDNDDLIAQKVELRLGEGKDLYDLIIKEVKKNEKLFLGKIDELGTTELSKYNSKAIVNRIYLTIRNMVGMDTDNLPKVQMIPAKDTPPSIKRAERVKNAIEYGFIRVNFMDFITKVLFDTRIKRDAFGKWFWNYDRNDFDLEPVMIEEITFSPEATTIQDAEYLIYHPLKNRKWWKDNYPAAYDTIKFENLKAVELTKGASITETNIKETGRGSVARLYEYWENDLTISMVYAKDGDRIILEKKKNPYYEYRDPLLQVTDWAKQAKPEEFMKAEQAGISEQEAVKLIVQPQELQNFNPIVNFLSEPRKPFVQFPSMKMLGKMYSSNIMAQAEQTLINYMAKKRQVADNLRGCNVKLVVDSNSFNEEERAAISDEPFQVLFADMQTNATPVQMVSPTFPELQGILADMQHDEKYIDDLFGSHEISRGSGNANTLGQDQMNYESDKTPIRMQSRATETAIKEITEGWIQLIKMFYTEKHWVKKLGGKEGVEMQDLINSDVEEGIEPLIIPQSMIKVDRVARAIQLFQANALDPYTLYTELEVADPMEKADRLVNWIKFGIISDQDPEKLIADMQNQATTGGDMTENPIERANSENEAFQAGGGKKVPPTPPELVTKEHVKLHYDFYKDPNKKMEQADMDLLNAHADVDKATLAKLMASGAANVARGGIIEGEKAKSGQPSGQPKKQATTKKPAPNVTVNVNK